VRDKRVKLVLAGVLLPVLAGMLFARLVVWIAWPSFPHHLLLGWLCVKLTVACVRYVQILLSRRQPQLAATPAYLTWVLALLLLDGLVWGSVLVIFPNPDQLAASAILCASMIGEAAIGSVTLAPGLRPTRLLSRPCCYRTCSISPKSRRGLSISAGRCAMSSKSVRRARKRRPLRCPWTSPLKRRRGRSAMSHACVRW